MVDPKMSETANEFWECKLFGKDGPGMCPTNYVPVLGKFKKVSTVEGEEDTLLVGGKNELLLIR